jgi:plastocyanin
MKSKIIATGAIAIMAAGAVAVPALSATKTVQVKDNFFAPKKLSVTAGTTVRWAWRGSAPHNVVVTKGPLKFKSKTITKGSYSRRVTRKGTYRIVCTIHAPAMRMTLTVR